AVTSPDFSMYGFYAQQAGSPLAVFEKPADSLVLEVDALVDFCRDKKARLLMLSNPCNPTSLLTGRAELLQLADALPNCLVVADEAYMDFAEGSVLDAVAGRSNLVVLRTCSKALGMAAIRLGFAVCPQPLANALRAVKSPYNVNAMTQAVGELIFDEPDYLRDCARRIRQSRDSLFVSLTALAEQQEQIISIANTQANFVFVKTTCSPALFRQAAQRGVALRLMGEYLRITAGSDEENREVIVLLSRLLTEEKRETV
ncbi:MAG: histidinol-phosphate transaminase, partial [Angelakisella sp.]